MKVKRDGNELHFSLEPNEVFQPHVFKGEVWDAAGHPEIWNLVVTLPAEVYAEHRVILQEFGFFRSGTVSVGSTLFVRAKKMIRTSPDGGGSTEFMPTIEELSSVKTQQEMEALALMRSRYAQKQ
jgi:hypothetical protein